MFKNKCVFISGGAGVIGSALVGKLQEAGAQLYIADLKPRPKDWSADITYRQGDLNEMTVQEMANIQPEYVFHLAATFERSTETYDFWDENDRHNVKLSHHLMSLLKESLTLRKVVFASSYLIYNPELYNFSNPVKEPTVLTEETPIYPRNMCGAAKLLHEIELRFLSEFSGDRYKTVSARIYRVYGKKSRDIISRWIQSLLNGEELQVYRKEGIFDYIYAGEVAEGLLRLAVSEAEGVVNLGNGNARRVEEVLHILRNYFPDMKYEEHDSTIPYEASEAGLERLQFYTGWKPTSQLEDTIPELINFYRDDTADSGASNAHSQAVLISSVSKKVPLIQSVRKAVSKLGIKSAIIGADSSSICIGRHFTDSFWQMPMLSQLTKEELLYHCRLNHIKYIVPTRDGELSYYAVIKSWLLAHGVHVLISEEEAVERCLDKLEFYTFGNKFNYPVIPTAETISDFDSVKESLWVVKERYGAGSINIGLGLTAERAVAHAASLKSPIFQPYVEGMELSADLYIDQNGSCKGVVLRKRELIVGGESQITSTLRDAKVEALVGGFAEKLGLYGHAVMQLIVDSSDHVHIIECNPRLGGASRLSLESGLDSLYWFLLECEGADLKEYPFLASETERRLVRYAEDLII